MKVFACGLGTETNSFCPIPTSRRDFKNDLFEGIVPGERGAFELWRDAAQRAGVDFERGSNYWAMPAGPVLAGAFESLKDELLAEIQAAAPMDVLLLYMHGAMVSEDVFECEAQLLEEARNVVGPDTVIGVELDPHANISARYIENADVLIEYKEWPHDDIGARALELFDLCLRTARKEITPRMAIADAELLGLIDTKVGKGAELVQRLHELEKREDVLSASLNHGFAWSDTPAVGAKALVVTNGDAGLAESLASDLAKAVVAVRDSIRIGVDAVAVDFAIDQALEGAKKGVRFAVCEAADAILTGGAGDATHVLERLVQRGVRNVAFAPIWDPMAVDFCKQYGVGATIDLRIGGKASRVSGDPVDVRVTVKKIVEGFTHAASPTLSFDGGDTVHVSTQEGLDIIISSKRYPVLGPSIFTDFQIDPAACDFIAIKAFRMARMAFKDVIDEFPVVITDGAMSNDVTRLPYQHAPRSLWPLQEI